MTDEAKGDEQLNRISDFFKNPDKYLNIDGIDYDEYEEDNIGSIVSYAPEFLMDTPYATHLRKILRQKAKKLDIEEWWRWHQESDLPMTANTITAGSWLSILKSISLYLARYDDYVESNKVWLTVDSRSKKKAIESLIIKSKAFRSALKNPNLPDIPDLYHFMSCGNLMFVSEHHQKLSEFCRKNGAKALYDESIIDILNSFEEYLTYKQVEHKGTTSKGDRHERELSGYLLENLHTNLFREKVKPITLIMLIINIRYKKNHTAEKIREWINS